MSSISCDRTRALISSALDGSLHELERRFLDAHLRRCDDCRSFADDTAWFTNLIRTAPLEAAPAITLPRRRALVQLRSVASVASVAAVLVVAVNVAMTPPKNESSEQALVASSLTPGPVGAESVRPLLRADLASGRLAVGTTPSEHSLGVVKPVLLPRSQ